MLTKVCTKCFEEKEFSKKDFIPRKDRKKNGAIRFYSWCRSCHNTNSRKWYETSPKARKTRKESNFKNNGIDLDCEEYDSLVCSQKNLCKICGKSECIKANSKYKKSIDLAVDHNHNSKKIRGLLCQKCNRALGLFGVDSFGVLNLQAAVKYIKDVEND
ncbi:MAG: endonuclease domain-containing protein [Nitrosopumilus sp.]